MDLSAIKASLPTEEEIREGNRNWHAKMYVNDMEFWYQKLAASGVLTPATKILHTDVELGRLWDGETPDGYADFLQELKTIANQFGYPCFLRTGYVSGKHDGYCFVESENALKKNVNQLIQFSGLIDQPINTWVLREFLKLESHFTAFENFPINRERRYFFENGEVVCHHPYWIKRAIENPNIENWEPLLEEINFEPVEEIKLLSELTRKVATNFEGAWSIDWAKTYDGKWYAIDMATASSSFHYDGCDNECRKWNTYDASKEYLSLYK